ncbi:MAG: YlmC/YmxH family sporulation protein [Syntrophomonadaceae bacterium]|jgi:YlmC/YmxH family sporulation protein|nr:YlmC/YmxH family sporulation protein [Syntrophomonadaceae bacterium]
MVKISELRTREVINILDGKKLGNIIDIDLDIERGRITAIVLPGPNRWFSLFSRKEDVVVPWHKINKIGRDVILVELSGFEAIDEIVR